MKQIKTKRNELEQLCYAIYSSIVSNIFSIDEKEVQILKTYIEETLDWFVELEVDKKRCELENKEFVIDEQDYQKRINKINDLCNNLYNGMLNININPVNSDIVNESSEPNSDGTSIESLLNQSN